jgi:hypothetical protein
MNGENKNSIAIPIAPINANEKCDKPAKKINIKTKNGFRENAAIPKSKIVSGSGNPKI